jgi:hypothetical protein
MQSRSPLQALNADQLPLLHTRVWMPHTPQDCTKEPTQVCPVQLPHWQDDRQVCVPPVPQAWVAFGVQTPSAIQFEKADHRPFAHERDRSPHRPQLSMSTCWPLHSMGWQAPHSQAWVHDCTLPGPHDWLVPGAQAP